MGAKKDTKTVKKKKNITITCIDWDVDLTWFGVIPGLQAEIREKNNK